ncbi:hypothetical protein BBP40_002386 [Aspergillus hancockii]|nr:hypothetical protein BBP40_002386 [Aspergillus hancockii]
MASNTNSTSTAVELQEGNHVGTRVTKPAADVTPIQNSDEVLQASLVADAQVPDGGYGWVIISGCAIITWWFIGIAYCWGVFQAALVKNGTASASSLAFVGSLAPACISFLGIINANVIRKLGVRVSGLLGIFLVGLGEVLSGFVVHNYFKTKRGIANGIVYAGGGLGGAVISFVMNALLEKVGIAWTFRILGFMIWGTGLPAACLLKERGPIRRTAFVEWRLFRDVRFSLLFAAGAIATFPLLVPPFFLPLYTESLEMAPSAGAGVVAAFNFSSALGRLLCGFCSDYVGPLNTLFMSLLLSALSMLILWPVSTSMGPLIVFVVINGMANGGFFSTIPTVVGNVFGSARVSVAMGMIVTGWAGGYLLGAPIAGYILNASGGEDAGVGAYRPAIFYAGGMALCAAVMAIFIRLKTDARPFKKL